MAALSSPGTGRARALLAIDAFLLLLPYPFVVLRLWSRRLTKMRLGLNDYLIVIALVFTTGYNVNAILVSALGGYGQHIWDVTPQELREMQKSAVVSTIMWPTATALVKLSILDFYRVVFSSKRKAVLGAYMLTTIAILYWLGTVITAFTLCQPFAYNWDKGIPGSCGNIHAYYLSTAILNLLIDVMIVVLPLPSVWSLQLSTGKKVSLTFIFSLGAGICAVSMVRCWSIATIDETDPTYNLVTDETTTILEVTLGIINACLPILMPVVKKASHSRLASSIKSMFSNGRRTKDSRQVSQERLDEFEVGDRHEHGKGKSVAPYELAMIPGSTTSFP